jgi:hypothetical protein
MDFKKISINQCQELAKRIGFNSTEFDLVGPAGRLKCVWFDAYFGIFEVEKGYGFMMASQIQLANDIHCENIRVKEDIK